MNVEKSRSPLHVVLLIAVFVACSAGSAAINAGGFKGNRDVAEDILSRVPTLYGHDSAVVVPTLYSAETVQEWLPEGLVLGHVVGLPEEGLYPVFILFNIQEDVGFRLSGHSFPLNYDEFAVLVPLVYFENDSDVPPTFYNYMPQLFLDEIAPIKLGWFWGFNKDLTWINADHSQFSVVRPPRLDPIISARFVDDGAPGTADDFLYFRLLVPTVSPNYVGHNRELGFVCSQQIWDFATAEVQSIDADVDIDQAFLSGIGPIVHQVTGIADNPLGAFRLKADWHFTSPQPCPY